MLDASKLTKTHRRFPMWRAAATILALTLGVALASSAASGAVSPHAAQTNVIQNGDFTTGGAPAADWTQVDVTDNPAGCDPGPAGTTGASGDGDVNCNGPYVFIGQSSPGSPICDPLPSGTPFMEEDVPDGSDAYIEQQVTVPADAALTFETWGYYQGSTATVSVVNAANQVTQLDSIDEPLLEGTNSCSGATAAQESIDMSAYAGQTVTLRFAGGSPSANYDGVYVNYDDIALTGDATTSTTSTSTTSTSTSTPTTTPTSPAGKRPSATQVNCSAFNPGTATEYFQCTATVGDASGDAVADTPTGTVSFSVNSGGGGGFQAPSQCALQHSESGPTAYCAVNYVPGSGGVATGTPVPVTASYGGDSTFGPSSATPQSAVLTTTDPADVTPTPENQVLADQEQTQESELAGPEGSYADYEDDPASGANAATPVTTTSAAAMVSLSELEEAQEIKAGFDALSGQDSETQDQLDDLSDLPDDYVRAHRVPAKTVNLGTVVTPVAVKLLLPAGSARIVVALQHLLTAEGTLKSESGAVTTSLARAKASDVAKLWKDATLQWTAVARYNGATATALKRLNADYQALAGLAQSALTHHAPTSTQIKTALRALAHPSKALVTDADRLGSASLLKSLERIGRASKPSTVKAAISSLVKGRSASAAATKALVARFGSAVSIDRKLITLLPS